LRVPVPFLGGAFKALLVTIPNLTAWFCTADEAFCKLARTSLYFRGEFFLNFFIKPFS